MQQAQTRYNSLYDNTAYQAVTQMLTNDLGVERASVTSSDTANLITDAALGLCGHPSYAESCHTLAIFCGRSGIRPTTIDAIHTYLFRFQQMGDTRADDFEAMAKTLYHLQALKSAIHPAICHANGIHSWQGRAAYDLLAASDYIMQAAENLLQHGDDDYIAEKLQSGLRRISGALREAVRYAGKPTVYADLCDK